MGGSDKRDHVWNKVFFVLELTFIPFVLWWMPYGHLPPSGWAVAFIALAAAAMSVHNDMKGWQKGIWMLIIGAFLVTELRAINKDRHDSERQVNLDRQNQYTAFEGIRAAQNSEFTVTANGLNAAISGID